jgi:hypothetical protein
MNRFDNECASKFADLCDKAGVEMTPENALKCIGFAKDAMEAGECSVEAFYQAKYLILSRVEVASELLN